MNNNREELDDIKRVLCICFIGDIKGDLSDARWIGPLRRGVVDIVARRRSYCNQIEQRTVTSLPANWQALRDRWEFFNVIRTWASVAGVALLLAGALFSRGENSIS
jgi:hypothetical protein